jgi:hypothetical protein
MGIRLPPKQLELYKRLDMILWHDWDPIGISAHPEARDEYYSYLPQVFGLVMQGANQDQLAAFLHKIETKTMGLWGSSRKCAKIASEILKLKDELGL